MAREKRKREWGTGSIVEEKFGLAIRWPEYVITPAGERRRKMRYEFLGAISNRQAQKELTARIAAAQRAGPVLEKVIPTFREHAEQYEQLILNAVVDNKPRYRWSTRYGRHSVLTSRLLPRFGSYRLGALTTLEIQQWVNELGKDGLAIDSIHDYFRVLRAVLKTAVKWDILESNPCTGVELVPKDSAEERAERGDYWALTVKQAGELIGRIHFAKVRTMVALALAEGFRRGELVAMRWKHLNPAESVYRVTENVYRGYSGPPKTKKGRREQPLHAWTLGLLEDWRRQSPRTGPDDFIFGTRTGRPSCPNTILRRYVFPACEAAKLPRATWQVFRRTFGTWNHENGVSAKTIAELMGHANVNMQFVYIQSVDQAKKVAVERIGEELSRFCPDEKQMSLTWVN